MSASRPSVRSSGVVVPLAPAQRMQLRALLHEQWRAHLDQLTGLSIRAYAAAGEERESADAELWTVRRALVEIETAMRRLDTGSYGRCDGCDRRIEFTLLRRRPHRRYCPHCSRRAAA